MSNYEREVVAKAIEHVYGAYKDGDTILNVEADEMVDHIHMQGYRLTREDTGQEYVSDGPIQRALGIDGGDGF